eukprot:6131848-Prymnesium_polylepis.1
MNFTRGRREFTLSKKASSVLSRLQKNRAPRTCSSNRSAAVPCALIGSALSAVRGSTSIRHLRPLNSMHSMYPHPPSPPPKTRWQSRGTRINRRLRLALVRLLTHE